MTAGIGPLVAVDDPDDHRLTDYRDLANPGSRRRYEQRRDVFVVEGRVALRELLRSRYPVVSLLVDDHQVTAIAELVDEVRAQGTPVYVGQRTVVAATVGFPLHRGVVAIARRLPLLSPEEVIAAAIARAQSAGSRRSVLAVLEGLNDHENLGALFRNAAAFGVGGVLLDPTCADPLYRRSVRVSSGHVLTVPFARLDPWPGALDRLHSAGFALVALAPEHHAETLVRRTSTTRGYPGSADGDPGAPPQRARAPAVNSATRQTVSIVIAGQHAAGPVALLLGAEGPGLSVAALDAADEVASIPMAAAVDSLNVATAAAIAFYELVGRSCSP